MKPSPNTQGLDGFSAFEGMLGYVFRSRELFDEALTHASYANESGIGRHNERLEFLGDAVLELCASEALYEANPDYDEGELTKARSRIVREQSLAEWARTLKLYELIKLSCGLEQQGGRGNASILADAMEAVIGAVFLDGGYEAGAGVVRKLIGTISAHHSRDDAKDAKSRLQEALQAVGGKPPTYRLIGRDGPDHAAVFEVEAVRSDGSALSTGRGNSIKAAEFAAAERALLKIGDGK
jgi:ribonuclease-3